jgi:hypothetical protein
MQINMGRWFESLSAEKQEEFGSVFIFWDSKFKAALGTAISDEDY